jgi:hypothetical protein
MAETITLAWIVNKAWILLVGYVWYIKRQHDQGSKDRDAIISGLVLSNANAELKYITESRLKEAMREELEPYREAQQEIKLLLRGLTVQMVELSKDMAVQNALSNHKDEST